MDLDRQGTNGGSAMPVDALIEQRLAAVEAAVAELQRRFATGPGGGQLG
jgi:hypothetical protein